MKALSWLGTSFHVASCHVHGGTFGWPERFDDTGVIAWGPNWRGSVRGMSLYYSRRRGRGSRLASTGLGCVLISQYILERVPPSLSSEKGADLGCTLHRRRRCDLPQLGTDTDVGAPRYPDSGRVLAQCRRRNGSGQPGLQKGERGLLTRYVPGPGDGRLHKVGRRRRKGLRLRCRPVGERESRMHGGGRGEGDADDAPAMTRRQRRRDEAAWPRARQRRWSRGTPPTTTTC